MASWCRYIRHPTQLCGLWTPPFVVNNCGLKLDIWALSQSGFSWSKSNTSSGRHAYLHIPFHFLVENLRYSAPAPWWHEMAARRREGGRGSLGALTCEYLTSDVRVLGPEVSINSRFLSCQQNISWAAAPIRPFPPQQLFIFTQWTRHQSSSRSYFLLGKIWLHCTEINVEVSYFSYSLSNGGIVFL